MDYTKRKAESPLLQPDSAERATGIDYTMPLEYLPPIIYQESALRSTQIAQPATVDHVTLKKDPTPSLDIYPSSSPPTFIAPDHIQSADDHLCSTPSTEYCTPVTSDTDEDDEIHVDTDNDADKVYLINSGPDTWSGTLSSEDDPVRRACIPYQASMALRQVKHAQDLADSIKSLRDGNTTMEALLTARAANNLLTEEDAKLKKDLLIRNIVRRIEQKLLEGACFVLDRLATHDQNTSCANLLCPAPNRLVPVGAYYLTLCKREEPATFYCLVCLEGLWSGDGMAGSLCDPRVHTDRIFTKQKISSISLDGPEDQAASSTDEMGESLVSQSSSFGFGAAAQMAQPSSSYRLDEIPQSLLSSKHAPSFDERPPAVSQEGNMDATAAPSPAFCSTLSSQWSTTSNGKWRPSPARFQYLAPYIECGSTLNEDEKTAVRLWKAVSAKQITQMERRERYAQTIATPSETADSQTEQYNIWSDALEATPSPRSIRSGDLNKVDEEQGTGMDRHTSMTAECEGHRAEEHEEEYDKDAWADVELSSGIRLRAEHCHGRNLSAVLMGLR